MVFSFESVVCCQRQMRHVCGGRHKQKQVSKRITESTEMSWARRWNDVVDFGTPTHLVHAQHGQQHQVGRALGRRVGSPAPRVRAAGAAARAARQRPPVLGRGGARRGVVLPLGFPKFRYLSEPKRNFSEISETLNSESKFRYVIVDKFKQCPRNFHFDE